MTTTARSAHDNQGFITPRSFKVSFVALAAIAIACSGAFFFGHAALAKQLSDWKVVPRPERFTELYFTDYHALPTTLKAGVKQKLDFTVHNLEHQTTTYTYLVGTAATDTGTEQPLAKGNFTLLAGQTQNVEQAIILPAPTKRAVIKVSLNYQGIVLGHDAPSSQTQTIHYWANVLDAPHAIKTNEGKHAAE